MHAQEIKQSIGSARSVINFLANRYTDGLNTESMDPYHRILWEVWMPPLRAAILAGWDVRNPEPLVSFIELWTPRVPGWILANILDSQVRLVVNRNMKINLYDSVMIND